MQTFLIITSVTILVLGIVFRNISKPNSFFPTPTPVPHPTLTVTVTPSPSLTPTPALTPVPVPVTVTVTPLPPSPDSWIYPNSSLVSTGVYTTPDSPAVVTDWYKNKIKTLNLNIRTFVQTSANDQILNKLSAAGAGQKISIEISKESGSALTNIKIALDN